MSNLDRVPDEPTDEPTQKTRPKKGEPIEIPVPSKDQIMGDFEKIATADEDEESLVAITAAAHALNTLRNAWKEFAAAYDVKPLLSRS